MNYIQTMQGDIWSRKESRWIDPESWQSWSMETIQRDCAYPTFKGCDRQANKLWRKFYSLGFPPYQWGAIKLDPTTQAQGVTA